MNPFGLAAGELPDEVMERTYDAATVFKNFKQDGGRHGERVRETPRNHGREFVVEVRKAKRLHPRDA